MNKTPIPPVPPPFIPAAPPKQKMTYASKGIFLGLQCLVLMLGTLVIWELVYSRDKRSSEVSGQIAEEWGKDVSIYGPIIANTLDIQCYISDTLNELKPDTFICKAQIKTESLHRNIYEAEVYNADVNLSAVFNKDNVIALSDSVYIIIHVDTKQIVKLSPLKIGEKNLNWSCVGNLLYAKVDVSDMHSEIELLTDFAIRGSWQFNIAQIGTNSEILFTGNASNPSFHGFTLPNERTINNKDFSAKWIKTDLSGHRTEFRENVGVWFLVGVDRYQKVARSLKYSFFIILLTYISVLFIEIMSKHEIPLLNYFLIGVALIIYYTLLLSFSEHMSFVVSYWIASVMTIILIALYLWKMLDSKKVSIAISIILTILYTSCYVLISLTTYALLIGSLMLFFVLAAMMYGSLKIKVKEKIGQPL